MESGYSKTDMWITLSNCHKYGFRFDVKHTSLPDNDTEFRQHMRVFFLSLCRPEELSYIASDKRRTSRKQ